MIQNGQYPDVIHSETIADVATSSLLNKMGSKSIIGGAFSNSTKRLLKPVPSCDFLSKPSKKLNLHRTSVLILLECVLLSHYLKMIGKFCLGSISQGAVRIN